MLGSRSGIQGFLYKESRRRYTGKGEKRPCFAFEVSTESSSLGLREACICLHAYIQAQRWRVLPRWGAHEDEKKKGVRRAKQSRKCAFGKKKKVRAHLSFEEVKRGGPDPRHKGLLYCWLIYVTSHTLAARLRFGNFALDPAAARCLREKLFSTFSAGLNRIQIFKDFYRVAGEIDH